METDFEDHTHRAAGEMIEWVAGVVWSVWDWRARWASHRGAAYYAALDQEKEQEKSGPEDDQNAAAAAADTARAAQTPSRN